MIILTSLIVLYCLCWLYVKRQKATTTFIEKSIIPYTPAPKNPSIKHRIMLYLSSLVWIMIRITCILPSTRLRRKLLRSVFGLTIDQTSSICLGTELIAPWNITMGSGSIIGIENKIDGRGGLFIGNHVNMSHQVNIWTMQHDVNDRYFSPVVGSVRIEDYVWIGNRVTVLPGLTLSQGCVIAAGSVVTKNTEPYGIYAGVPAKKIGERSRDLDYTIDFAPLL